jgi:hypothetical protein
MTAVAFPKPVRAPRKARRPLPRKRMKRGPSRRSLNRKLAESLYLRWLHARSCVLAGFECNGPIQQSHARNIGPLPTGMGRKESDFQSVPMCSRHHLEQWEARAGAFAGWTNDQRRAWMVATIAAEHLAYQLEGGVVI